MKTIDSGEVRGHFKIVKEKIKTEVTKTEELQKSISALNSSRAIFMGKTADSIFSFYQECHLPFLQYFKSFSDDYLQTMENIKDALEYVEDEKESHCYIDQSFLENNIKPPLKKIKEYTIDSVSEANNYINSVDFVRCHIRWQCFLLF
ncbi:T7SS effector LXG polymorphic toxin [Bacillus massilinigeriensis]|uniref:T7SS effector LXG polymorphic toxin n=1 Tax=Bacillus mediterraneensis TaxID=1805474 RepID=UPI0008F865B4|nr:T7SS effector LXG polymorphic toxin [Bacillus mediterraneensis]